MTAYNYHWSEATQKKKAEKRLFNYIENVITKYSPFYREYFEKHKIDPNSFDFIDDFLKIPPITKKDHMKNPASFILLPYQPNWWECNFTTEKLPGIKTFTYWLKSLNKKYLRSVFGKERVVEDERVAMEAVNEWLPIHFHTTKGSADPALIAFTKRDLSKNVPEIIAQLYLTGFKANWEVFNTLPIAPSINSFQSVWTPLTVGGGTFFTGGEEFTPIQKQLDLVSSITFEVFLGTPSYTKKWLETAIEKLPKKKSISSFKLCLLTGEPMTVEKRTEIKALFDKLGSTPKIINSYSNNRMKATFFECSEGSDIHLNPRYFYWEVLGIKSNEPVEDGEPGYLCFSHIDWRGTAFLRYNTGDLVEGIKWERCKDCGLVFPKIIGTIKRKMKK
ncbi:MAG: AMP-binding protein [Asgard group archaeon]|nr:AMP-binding protein [Asgard group archaeon]